MTGARSAPLRGRARPSVWHRGPASSACWRCSSRPASSVPCSCSRARTRSRRAWQYLVLPLTTQFGLLEVLVTATPILLTGAAVAHRLPGRLLEHRGGGPAARRRRRGGRHRDARGRPADLCWPSRSCCAGGALAGALWVLGPALLRVRLGIDEVVTTLLLNPVALLLVDALLHGPWRDPETGFPESPRIAASAFLPTLIAQVAAQPRIPGGPRGHRRVRGS